MLAEDCAEETSPRLELPADEWVGLAFVPPRSSPR
jgi:hypothetical protein